ncbi:Htaa domain protein [Streptomyces abyssalis]|uniref:Htaa domain protein n=1 Tax=Streptomyces abyssalis TaxID=933944 RepID=A0A1E7JI35_9ACTN|nr:HtaA domain-containing protein [Streptomyces abyssalis]OEU86136.1 Htaa domain protein [Streptomyces abyssalis]OEU92398.1 Htaa domain protein [Streptomyces abyssalis]OEV29179.1 Htaa domain protein [Streptomyces nanshensis]
MPHRRCLPRTLAVTLLAAVPLAALPATTAQAGTPRAATAGAAGAVEAESAERAVSGGRLDWGIKASFQSYVTGPIAKGRWALDGGTATAGRSRFRFHSADGSYAPDSGAFDAAFQGGVRFTGHKKPDGTHELDLTVSRPAVRIDGGSGTLYADIRSKAKGSGRLSTRAQVPLASLDLSGVNMRGGKSPVALTDVPAALTAAGAKSFAGYYKAGTPLDPVSLSVDLKAKTGKRDGSGGGKSVKDGARKPEEAGRIEDGSVDWGVRRTFREYVTGAVAKGRWKLTGGAQDGGALFRFGQGKGEYDTGKGTLDADFTGAVRFTGRHLDLTLSKFSVRVEDGEGTLSADVRSDGGTAKKQPLVTFAAKKSALEPGSKGLVVLTEVPAKLTPEGAEAFGGMYAEGTAMDPVSLAVALDGDADLPPLPDLGSGSSASAEKAGAAETGRTEKAASGTSASPAVPLVVTGGAVALLLAAGATFAVVRRRRGGPAAG